MQSRHLLQPCATAETWAWPSSRPQRPSAKGCSAPQPSWTGAASASGNRAKCWPIWRSASPLLPPACNRGPAVMLPSQMKLPCMQGQGASILESLHGQRMTIQLSKDKLQEANENISTSQAILRRMGRWLPF